MKQPSIAVRLVLTVFITIAIIAVGFGVVIRSLSSVENTLQSESTQHISSLTVNSTISRQVFELSSRVQLLEQAFLYSETALSEESFNIDLQLQQMRDLSDNYILTQKMDDFIEAFHRFLGSSLSLNRILKNINNSDVTLNEDLHLLDFYLSNEQLNRLLSHDTPPNNGLDSLNMMRESYLKVGKLVGTIRSRITPETEKVVILEVQKELGIFLLHLHNVPAFNQQIQAQKKLIERHIKRYNASLRKMKANLDQRWAVIASLVEAQVSLLMLAETTEENVQQSALAVQTELENNISETRLLISIVGIIALITGLLLILRMVSTHIQQPLRKLNIGLRNIESNDFYERVHLGKTDEWGKIETAFNRMAAQLQTTYSELDEERKKFNFLAHHDPLTGLTNRLLGTQTLRDTIKRYKLVNQHFSLLYLDIDQFKTVNDSLGHEAGDQLLKDISYSLSKIVASHGVVARMGGDEFMVILNKVDSAQHSLEIAGSINKALRQPYGLEDRTIFVSASIGACHFPEHGSDAETLIRNADTAMYQAKRDGRDCTKIYEDLMTLAANDLIDLSSGLHNAIEEDELLVYYQPIIDMKTRNIVGAEALVRWNHPLQGLLFPDSFLPIAEKSGLAAAIDGWVFKKVTTDITSWKKNGFAVDDFLFSVNFSGRKFYEKNLQADLQTALNGHPELAKQIIIEITERDMVLGYENSIDTIQSLRDSGYLIAIDDFGVGHSSLASLQKIPADIIKLDRSFVANIEHSERDIEIVKSIKSLVDQLNLELIIEGIETEEQATTLINIGSTLAQGFLYAKPMPSSEFLTLIDNLPTEK